MVKNKGDNNMVKRQKRDLKNNNNIDNLSQ